MICTFAVTYGDEPIIKKIVAQNEIEAQAVIKMLFPGLPTKLINVGYVAEISLN